MKLFAEGSAARSVKERFAKKPEPTALWLEEERGKQTRFTCNRPKHAAQGPGVSTRPLESGSSPPGLRQIVASYINYSARRNYTRILNLKSSP